MKNCKIKNVDWEIKKQINTQVKLHFEKTNYENKTFYQRSHLTGATAAMYFFSFWNLIPSLVENYWFQFGNKVKLKAFNAKQSKNILKDTIHHLKMIGVGK